jgi:sulfur carrier protein
MNLTINGKQESIEGSPTISEVIARLGKDPAGKGLAVALNGEVVPRSKWDQRRVETDDRIELLEAAQGG